MAQKHKLLPQARHLTGYTLYDHILIGDICKALKTPAITEIIETYRNNYRPTGIRDLGLPKKGWKDHFLNRRGTGQRPNLKMIFISCQVKTGQIL